MNHTPTAHKTAGARLAHFVANTPVFPSKTTISITRDALIDTLGCILVGSRQPVAQKTQATVAAWGQGQAPIFGTELSVAAPWAALANATAGHALDFDDWEIPGNSHSSVVIFPALLAVGAEAAAKGQSYSGKAILDAYIVGFEIIARIGEAVNFEHYDKGWHTTGTLAAVGAAAAVARLKGFNGEMTGHALSLAVSQAVGYTTQFGSNAKPLQGGFAAKVGVVAAALAEQGLTGQPHVLESDKGFNMLLGHGDMARFWAVFDRWNGSGDDASLALTEYGLVFKPYPSCGYTHRAIDCALAMRQESRFDLNTISKIRVSLPDMHAGILPFQQPTKRAEALFSIPFCVAQALIYGGLGLADIEAERWEETAVRSLIAKTTLLVRQPKRPDLNYDADDPDWLEVELANGTILRTEVAFPLGAPQNRLSSEQIMAKFRGNAAFSVENEAVISALAQWDTASDINHVVNQIQYLSIA
ncbi:MAG: MmgE/PrpD family protein [Chloroflexota bacterium]